MQIAILGATSQIARDLIISFSFEKDKQLHLFARRPDEVTAWLKSVGLSGRYVVSCFKVFGEQEFDTIINFVGVGNPAAALAMGSKIFDITLQFDDLTLNYLQKYPSCRYLFLSSGAAYGSNFDEPVDQNTQSIVAINNLAPHEWYGVAKLHVECRHRAHSELHIIDIRVFNYFSHTQNIEARFLITDILRAIRDKSILGTSSENIVRDFLHPIDFYCLISALLVAPAINTSVDCYSRSPIDKFSLLFAMQKKYGLRYELTQVANSVNATGNKLHYYSRNTRAADFGYKPIFTSLDGILDEVGKVLDISIESEINMNDKECDF
jgi:nucleoside-diphosphate-sugar epimerase